MRLLAKKSNGSRRRRFDASLQTGELERVIEERGNAMHVVFMKHSTCYLEWMTYGRRPGLIDEINSVVGERQIPAEPELFHS